MFILKILNGIQSGVEVLLKDGEYTLGSSSDDDIELYDITVNPKHALLTVSSDNIFITAQESNLYTRSGDVLSHVGEVKSLQPFEIVTIGTSHFTLAPTNADWSGLRNINSYNKPLNFLRKRINQLDYLRHLQNRHFITAGSIALFLIGLWIFPYFASSLLRPFLSASTNIEILQTALNSIDTTGQFRVSEDNEGHLFVTGLVEDNDTINETVKTIKVTGLNPVVKIGIEDDIKAGIDHILLPYASDITYTISAYGDVSLQGIARDQTALDEIIKSIRDIFPELASLNSSVKTTEEVLNEVKGLARVSLNGDEIDFSYENSAINASGRLTSEKTDAWAGFLLAYALHDAATLPLISTVSIFNADHTINPSPPGLYLYLGELKPSNNSVKIDIGRLQNGTYLPKDLFVNMLDTQRSASTALPVQQDISTTPIISHVPIRLPPPVIKDKEKSEISLYEISKVLNLGKDTALTSISSKFGTDKLAEFALSALKLWKEKPESPTEEQAIILNNLTVLNEKSSITGTANVETYLQHLLKLDNSSHVEPCWPHSAITQRNILATQFWLDFMLISKEITLQSFSLTDQLPLIEAALSPVDSAQCANKVSGLTSRYLYSETAPDSASVLIELLKNTPQYPFAVTGFDKTSSRYIQMSDGHVLFEGSMASDELTVTSIGELGIVLVGLNEIQVGLFNKGLVWETFLDKYLSEQQHSIPIYK